MADDTAIEHHSSVYEDWRVEDRDCAACADCEREIAFREDDKFAVLEIGCHDTKRNAQFSNSWTGKTART